MDTHHQWVEWWLDHKAFENGRTLSDAITDLVTRGAASQMSVEIDREVDGRWIGEVAGMSGALAYGSTRREARAKALAIAQTILSSRTQE